MIRKVYDCFLLSDGEEHLLSMRLRHLWDRVDIFVIAEGDRYFNGDEKPMCFQENEAEFRWAQEKIAYAGVQLNPTPQPWENESGQRNALLEIAKDAGAEPYDVLILSDIDELPRTDALDQAIHHCPEGGPIRFELDMYYLYLNNRLIGKQWPYGPIVMTADQVRWMHWMRTQAWPLLAGAGWHFQYLGGPERFVTKMKTGSHADPGDPCCDDVERMTDLEAVRKAYADPTIDLFRDHHKREVAFETVDISDLPPCIALDPEKYEHLIWRPECESASQ